MENNEPGSIQSPSSSAQSVNLVMGKTSQAPIPAPRKKWAIFLFILVLISAIVAGAVLLLRENRRVGGNINTRNNNVSLQTVFDKETLIVPEISGRQQAALKDLPDGIQRLVLDGATDVKVEQSVLPGGGKMQQLSYSLVTASLQQVYDKLGKGLLKSGALVRDGARNAASAFWEGTYRDNSFKAELTTAGQGSIKAAIYVFKK